MDGSCHSLHFILRVWMSHIWTHPCDHACHALCFMLRVWMSHVTRCFARERECVCEMHMDESCHALFCERERVCVCETNMDESCHALFCERESVCV